MYGVGRLLQHDEGQKDRQSSKPSLQPQWRFRTFLFLACCPEKALDDSRTQCRHVFNEKETLMLEEIKQGKMIK